MGAMRSTAWLLSLVLVLAGCSGSGNGSPDDGGPDDASMNDGGTDDGGTRPDHDPGESFLLVVPEGISMCSGFAEGRTWEQEHQMAGRIDLAPGHHVLEREEGSTTSSNPFEQVLFGPAREPATLSGDTCRLEITTWGGTYTTWIYDLVVPVQHDGRQGDIDLRIQVDGSDQAWPEEIHVGQVQPRVHVTAELRLGAGVDPLTEVQRFAGCDLPDPPHRSILAVAENGDRVELTVHRGPWYDACFAAGETACLFLTRARVELGDHQADVDDRLRLVYSGSHHNWFDQYLVLLDPPAGDVHALLAIAPGFSGEPSPEFVYLDADLGKLRREAVSAWDDPAP